MNVSLNVYADCGTAPLDVKHLFVCPAHATTMTPSHLWSRSAISRRDPDWNEHGLKGESQSVTATGLNQFVYSPNCYIQIFRLNFFPQWDSNPQLFPLPIALYTIKCSNNSSRLWWTKIKITPFPSIGLGRWTTTTKHITRHHSNIHNTIQQHCMRNNTHSTQINFT